MGTNAHYGTPFNAAAPGHVPGGSSSGSAAALASGAAELGLGTDTAGSLRVPGSFSALYAWRPTHGIIDTTGVLPLAHSFDTLGLLARDAVVLEAAAAALLPRAQVQRAQALLRSRTLLHLAQPPAALAVEAAMTALAVQTGLPIHDLDDDFTLEQVAAWTAAFRTVQAAEAWANHGGFISANPGALSPDVEERFRAGVDIDAHALQAARSTIAQTAARLETILQRGWLCLPSTASPAPPIEATSDDLERIRTAPCS